MRFTWPLYVTLELVNMQNELFYKFRIPGPLCGYSDNNNIENKRVRKRIIINSILVINIFSHFCEF